MNTGLEPMTDKYDAPLLVGNQSKKRFHVMAKPSGSTCNLDCDYCFYLSKETLPDGPGPGRMSDEVLEKFIQQYIAGVTGPEVVFSWQGGEPTLMGLDFFRKVVALEKNTPSRSRKSRMISRPTARSSTRNGASFSRKTVSSSA
jgi:uncharacterized protein